MRILLTGGTGFVGSNFARHAVAAGHEVLSLSRRPTGPEQAGGHVEGSVESPPWSRIDPFQPEVLVHTAWEATPGVYLESPENPHWVNWSEALVRSLAARGARQFVLLGTCIEYQVTGTPMQEDATPLAPLSTYARCKDELRRRLMERPPDPAARLAWARLFYPYGPGEHPSRLCSSLIHRLGRGETVTLNTPDSIKDYLHIDDVGRALVQLVEARHHGTINIGSGQGVTVLSLARQLASLMDRTGQIRPAERPAIDPLFHVVADTSRLRSLGWSPQVGLDAGLRGLLDALGS